MLAFAYTVTIADRKGITEASGVLQAESMDQARARLISLGYVVRDLRPARQEEMRLQAFRALRKKLGGQPIVPPIEIPNRNAGMTLPPFPTKIFLWLLAITAILLITFWRS